MSIVWTDIICPNCLEDEIKCDWPLGDGRSQRVRKSRVDSKDTVVIADRMTGMQEVNRESDRWKMQGDWLEGLDGVASGESS